MLYNKELKRLKKELDCQNCKYFDVVQKRCKGFGVNCFEYDPLNSTCIDPITKLPFEVNNDR